MKFPAHPASKTVRSNEKTKTRTRERKQRTQQRALERQQRKQTVKSSSKKTKTKETVDNMNTSIIEQTMQWIAEQKKREIEKQKEQIRQERKARRQAKKGLKGGGGEEEEEKKKRRNKTNKTDDPTPEIILINGKTPCMLVTYVHRLHRIWEQNWAYRVQHNIPSLYSLDNEFDEEDRIPKHCNIIVIEILQTVTKEGVGEKRIVGVGWVQNKMEPNCLPIFDTEYKFLNYIVHTGKVHIDLKKIKGLEFVEQVFLNFGPKMHNRFHVVTQQKLDRAEPQSPYSLKQIVEILFHLLQVAKKAQNMNKSKSKCTGKGTMKEEEEKKKEEKEEQTL
jgi:hypothetical protein